MRRSLRSCGLPAAALAAWALLPACGDTSTSPQLPAEPDLPRGEYEILVERISPAGEHGYYATAPDGTRAAPFTGLPDGTVRVVPSPDGRSLACLVPTPAGDQHLWVVSRDGSGARPVLQGTRFVSHAAWSPDGTRFVVAASTFTEEDDLFILGTDGSGLTNIAPDPRPGIVSDRHPSWSPDGTRIAFQSNRSGITRLWVMDADGTDPRPVLGNEAGTQASPAWSPDGELIAFVVPGQGIGLVRPDGSDSRVVPAAGGAAPAWTPDGRLLFSADVLGDREIFVLDPAGGEPANLSAFPGQDLAAVALPYVAPPAWRGFAGRTVAGPLATAGIVAGDLTADGLTDLALPDTAAGAVHVLRQDEDGGFTLLVPLAAPGVQGVAAVADLSRDGAADLVVLGAESFTVWRGDPAGPGAPTAHPLAGPARGLAVADFDRDGHADIAGVHAARDPGLRMLVHGTRPDGELIAILDYAAGFASPGRAAAGDVTGDAAPDVVILTAAPAAPVLLAAGRGDITFAAAVVASAAVAADPDAVPLCADLDGDRRDDLVLLVPGDGGAVVVLRSTGTGFAAPVAVGAGATAVAAADFDRDADVDLVVARGDGPARFLRNRGGGEFARPEDIPWPAAGAHPVRLAVADLDGDPWPDLAAVDGAGRVGVLVNRGR